MSGSVWKKPDEVMKQMREKKRALQARFSHAIPTTTTNSYENDEKLASVSAPASTKRKNPFRYSKFGLSCQQLFSVIFLTDVLQQKDPSFSQSLKMTKEQQALIW